MEHVDFARSGHHGQTWGDNSYNDWALSDGADMAFDPAMMVEFVNCMSPEDLGLVASTPSACALTPITGDKTTTDAPLPRVPDSTSRSKRPRDEELELAKDGFFHCAKTDFTKRQRTTFEEFNSIGEDLIEKCANTQDTSAQNIATPSNNNTQDTSTEGNDNDSVHDQDEYASDTESEHSEGEDDRRLFRRAGFKPTILKSGYIRKLKQLQETMQRRRTRKHGSSTKTSCVAGHVVIFDNDFNHKIDAWMPGTFCYNHHRYMESTIDDIASIGGDDDIKPHDILGFLLHVVSRESATQWINDNAQTIISWLPWIILNNKTDKLLWGMIVDGLKLYIEDKQNKTQQSILRFAQLIKNTEIVESCINMRRRDSNGNTKHGRHMVSIIAPKNPLHIDLVPIENVKNMALFFSSFQLEGGLRRFDRVSCCSVCGEQNSGVQYHRKICAFRQRNEKPIEL